MTRQTIIRHLRERVSVEAIDLRDYADGDAVRVDITTGPQSFCRCELVLTPRLRRALSR
jgi:hypothetical protein